MHISIEGSVTLARDEARVLTAYACQDETREQLNGVIIEPERLRCWSTDGHRAVMGRRMSGTFPGRCPPVRIPTETMREALRMCRSATDSVVIYPAIPHVAEEGGAKMLPMGRIVGLQAVAKDGRVRGSTHVKSSDVPIPNIDAVLNVPDRPTGPACPAFGMSGEFLADIALVTSASGVRNLALYPGEHDLAPLTLRATSNDDTEWTAAIMPAKVETGAAYTFSAKEAVSWAVGVVRQQLGKAAGLRLLDAFEKAQSGDDEQAPEQLPEADGEHVAPVVSLDAHRPEPKGRAKRKRSGR